MINNYSRTFVYHIKGDCGSLALWLLKPGSVATKTLHPFNWTLSTVLAFCTFGYRVRIRKLIKNNYFLQFENTVCGITQKLSFIYIVFIFNYFSVKSAMTPQFYFIVMKITYCFAPLKCFAEI